MQKKRLQTGDKVPHFILADQNGKEFDIQKVLGKKKLVIYFYPKDHTPGCTAEACAFRDMYEEFLSYDCEVIGISSDKITTHARFSQKYQLPFPLLSDEKGKVRKLFGVPDHVFGLLPGRVTYLVDQKGTIKHIFNSQFKIQQHIKEMKGMLQKPDA